MSKLDDILSNTAGIIAEGVFTGEWAQAHTKNEIKAFALAELLKATQKSITGKPEDFNTLVHNLQEQIKNW